MMDRKRRDGPAAGPVARLDGGFGLMAAPVVRRVERPPPVSALSPVWLCGAHR